MKYTVFILTTLLLLSLAGCAAKQPATIPIDSEQPPNPETETVVVPQPEQPASETPEQDAPVVEQKQLDLGSTTITNQTQEIISDIECAFSGGEPSKFSFKLTNVENKDWVFEYVPTADRDEKDNPLFILNAAQLVNSNIVSACKTRRIMPGESAQCNFDVFSNPILQSKLMTGVTGFGTEKKNMLVVKTVGHASEVKFLCE